MARKKFRVTGFTRFLLFLIIITPLAYFGVLFAKGEKMPSSLDEVIESFQKTTPVSSTKEESSTKPASSAVQDTEPKANSTSTDSKDCEELEAELEDLEARYLRKSNKVDDLEAEVENLKKQIEFLQKEE